MRYKGQVSYLSCDGMSRQIRTFVSMCGMACRSKSSKYRSLYEPVCRMTGQNAARTCACNDILKPCIVLERKDKVKRVFTLMGKLTFKYA